MIKALGVRPGVDHACCWLRPIQLYCRVLLSELPGARNKLRPAKGSASSERKRCSMCFKCSEPCVDPPHLDHQCLQVAQISTRDRLAGMQALHRKMQGENLQLRQLLADLTRQQEEKAARQQVHKEAKAKRREAHRHPLKVRRCTRVPHKLGSAPYTIAALPAMHGSQGTWPAQCVWNVLILHLAVVICQPCL